MDNSHIAETTNCGVQPYGKSGNHYNDEISNETDNNTLSSPSILRCNGKRFCEGDFVDSRPPITGCGGQDH